MCFPASTDDAVATGESDAAAVHQADAEPFAAVRPFVADLSSATAASVRYSIDGVAVDRR